MIEFDVLKNNWETYEKLCKRLSDPRLNALLETLGERILMCPASPRDSQYGAYAGGLVEHGIGVTKVMRDLVQVYGLSIPVNSIIKAGLLHDLGKVGDLDKDYFVEQTSDWHRDKLGQVYKFNEELNKMSVSHRTLYLLQHFGIALTNDEWLAIQLAQGSHFEENRFYVGHESGLALVLQQAKQRVAHKDLAHIS